MLTEQITCESVLLVPKFEPTQCIELESLGITPRTGTFNMLPSVPDASQI